MGVRLPPSAPLGPVNVVVDVVLPGLSPATTDIDPIVTLLGVFVGDLGG
ncbi:MAG: hypothetical protein ACFCVK_05450 [Acidimicrobiales bacterium]